MASGWISEYDIPQLWKDKLQPAASAFCAVNHCRRHTLSCTPRYTTSAQRARELIVVHLYTEVAAFFAIYTAQIRGLVSQAAPADDAEITDYVQRETNMGTGVKTIRNLALERWKMNVLETLAPRLERALGIDKTRIALIRAKFVRKMPQ
ncbi:hypothetical protein DFH06DRAFT_1347195 [Mycena polygramma]|nr:hypothetical protein DFH06DRAFT_1347195 [Mycena polygramma]